MAGRTWCSRWLAQVEVDGGVEAPGVGELDAEAVEAADEGQPAVCGGVRRAEDAEVDSVDAGDVEAE